MLRGKRLNVGERLCCNMDSTTGSGRSTVAAARARLRAVGVRSEEARRMARVKRTLISVVVIVALLFAVCTVKPAPAHALDDTALVLIIIGGVIVGGIIIALIVTFFVRDNPAWMPAVPEPETAARGNPWNRPDERVKFGLSCGAREGGVPLICW
jgi:hypothetical protein